MCHVEQDQGQSSEQKCSIPFFSETLHQTEGYWIIYQFASFRLLFLMSLAESLQYYTSSDLFSVTVSDTSPPNIAS